MALPAESLPVVFIPEKIRAIARWLDVVQLGRLRRATILQALGTQTIQRIGIEPCFTGFAVFTAAAIESPRCAGPAASCWCVRHLFIGRSVLGGRRPAIHLQ